MAYSKKKEEIIKKLVKSISDSYPGLDLGAAFIAKKYNKQDELIEFLKNCSPSSVDLVEFLVSINPNIPPPFKD